MDDDVEAHAVLRERFEGAIARLEQTLTTDDAGSIVAAGADDLRATDDEVLQQLLQSLDATNQSIADGTLQLSAIALQSSGDANA